MNISKEELRDELRAARHATPAEVRQLAAAELCRNVQGLNYYKNSHNLALYWPHDEEIDCLPILNAALASGKNCFLPVLLIDPRQKLAFASYTLDTPLVKNRYGILEPELSVASMISLIDLDLILVPVVGFDRSGRRLGRGGGFYDATFSDLHKFNANKWPRLVGLAYSSQEVDQIPNDSWDWRLDTIVTEQEIFDFNLK